jgi:hypothetical protein
VFIYDYFEFKLLVSVFFLIKKKVKKTEDKTQKTKKLANKAADSLNLLKIKTRERERVENERE